MFMRKKGLTFESFLYRHTKVVFLIFILVAALGVYSIFKIPVNILPGRSEHVVTIITEYPDMEPEAVKDRITKPIEGVLKNTRNVLNFYSFSSRGRSRIICYFNEDENIDEFIIRLSDSIYQISKSFPAEVRTPLIYRYNTDDSPVMIISVSPKMPISESETRDLLESRLKAKLNSLDGVANVELAGVAGNEFNISLNYNMIGNLKMNYLSLLKYITGNNTGPPVGSFKNYNVDVPIRLLTRYKTVPEIENHGIRAKNAVLRGCDLVEVSTVKRISSRFSMINDEKANIFYIYRQADSPVLAVENRVMRTINDYSASISWKILYSRGSELRRLYRSLSIALAVSFMLVFAFLVFIYRKTVFLLIPVVFQMVFSILGALLVLYITGAGLNILSIAGLVIGMIFSAFFSVLLLENFLAGLRRKRKGLYNTAVSQPETIDADDLRYFKYAGERETQKAIRIINSMLFHSARPIIVVAFISAVVFIPVSFVTSGLDAKLWLAPYRDFAISLFLVLALSAISSFTIFPAVLFKIMERYRTLLYGKIGASQKMLNHRLCGVFSACTEFFTTGILNRSQNRKSRAIRYGALMFIGLSLAASLYFAYNYFNTDYHEIDPAGVNRGNNYEFYFQFDPGFTKEYRINAAKQIVQQLLKSKSKNINNENAKKNGRPVLVTTLEGNRIKFCSISSKEAEEAVVKSLKLKKLEISIGGILSYLTLKFGLKKKIKKIGYIYGQFESLNRRDGFFYQRGEDRRFGTLSLRVMIFGDNISRVDELADICAEKISGVTGVKQIMKGYREGSMEISIVPDNSKLFFYNLNYDDLETFLRYMFYRPVIFKHYSNNSLVDVRAGFNRYSSDIFKGHEDAADIIAGIKVPVGNGEKSIRIGDFARVNGKNGSSEISRKNGKPYIALDIRYISKEGERVAKNIKNIMDAQRYQLGEYYRMDDNKTNGRKTKLVLVLSSLIAGFLIWLFLAVFFGSFVTPLVLIPGLIFIFMGESTFMALSGELRSISFELSIVVAALFLIYSGVILLSGFIKRKKGSYNRNDVESILIFKNKVILINFAIFILFLAPLFVMPGLGKLFKTVSGSILASLIFILIFFLAILPILCIMLRHSSKF